MYLKNMTNNSTQNYLQKIEFIRKVLAEADSVIVGAGAGLSTAAGFEYSGERFHKFFGDFEEKYGFHDMYSGGFYPYETPEEYWAFWSRYIYINRYCNSPKNTYSNLFSIIKDKDYFVITTNVDHHFQKSGFDKNRLFYTQGDYGLFQCKKPCENVTFDNEELIKKMYYSQKDQKVPSELIPMCPDCGEPLTMNLRCDDRFVQDSGWYEAYNRYDLFLSRHKDRKTVFLELGVGYNTPVIIKYPFWKVVQENPNSTYICINYGESECPDIIEKQSICINEDIDKVLLDLL